MVLIFVLAIFHGVMALADSSLVPATLCNFLKALGFVDDRSKVCTICIILWCSLLVTFLKLWVLLMIDPRSVLFILYCDAVCCSFWSEIFRLFWTPAGQFQKGYHFCWKMFLLSKTTQKSRSILWIWIFFIVLEWMGYLVLRYFFSIDIMVHPKIQIYLI